MFFIYILLLCNLEHELPKDMYKSVKIPIGALEDIIQTYTMTYDIVIKDTKAFSVIT